LHSFIMLLERDAAECNYQYIYDVNGLEYITFVLE